MTRFLASTAACALLSGAALAADIPAYEPAPMITPVAPAADWTGFYVGAGGGWAWGEVDSAFTIPPGGAGPTGGATYDVDGWLAGAQIGADLQWNWLVIGARADAYWTSVDGDDGGEDGAIDESETNWLASGTLRGGIAIDRFLPYVTGGVAVLDYEHTLTDPVGGASESQDDTEFGWTLGGGAEVMITQNISLWGEYRHYWFDGDEATFAGPGAIAAQDITDDLDLDTVTVGRKLPVLSRANATATDTPARGPGR